MRIEAEIPAPHQTTGKRAPIRRSGRDSLPFQAARARAGQRGKGHWPHASVTAAFEPGAAEMVQVKVEGASESEQEKVRWLGDIVRKWLLRDPSTARLL